jgi:hypothetical protein
MKNKNIQTEIDASFLYQKLTDHEIYPIIAIVFRRTENTSKIPVFSPHKCKVATDYDRL